MKKIIIKSIILLILYILFIFYFAVFNWQVFTVKLNVNLGFGILEFPPFIILSVIGLIIISILSWSNYNIRLRKMIYELEHGMEMGKIREKLSSGKIKEALTDDKILDQLKDKLGIREILKIQEKHSQILKSLQEKSNKDNKETDK